MMKHRSLTLALVFTLSTLAGSSQKLKKADRQLHDQLKAHITYLADDKLQGRRAGTPGEQLAATYISNQFEKAGLQPKGTNGWLQSFEINDGKQINPNTFLIINGHDLKLGKDFFPLCYSPNASTEAAFSTALREEGVPWVVDLKDSLEAYRDNPHFDSYQLLRTTANTVAEKGATALIVYNTSEVDDKLEFKPKDRSEKSRIPVVYLSKEAVEKYLHENPDLVDLKLKIDIGGKKRTAHNVIGYIDNGAANTVVLGAHYDHLGYGEDGNSMVRTADKQIHNGADDNASGTAVLIELAKILKASKNKTTNYLFIAFSGEELGLFGSKYFTEHPTIDLRSATYMLNMDMVGRLDEASKALTIGGYGTSPAWKDVFTSIKDARNFSIRYDSSGSGPSDHTSFYRKNIPVLFFFTGLHNNYHRPDDDADRINTMGTLRITRLIAQVVEKANAKGKLDFTTTRDRQVSSSTSFNVSLGVMPDYTFTGEGMRIDGVSAGRAAEKAGMKAGDIIVALGDHVVDSMETYMKALSAFNRGDSTVVKFKRGNELMQADVKF